jgi:hypothetical protein
MACKHGFHCCARSQLWVIAIVITIQDSNSSRLLPGSSYSCRIRNHNARVQKQFHPVNITAAHEILQQREWQLCKSTLPPNHSSCGWPTGLISPCLPGLGACGSPELWRATRPRTTHYAAAPGSHGQVRRGVAAGGLATLAYRMRAMRDAEQHRWSGCRLNS